MSGTSKKASNFATGVFFGVSAYAMWGLLPLYWQLMDGVPATEILVHRGLWALVICVAFLMISRKIAVFWGLIKDRRMLSILAFAALLLTGNWGVYIWSVTR